MKLCVPYQGDRPLPQDPQDDCLEQEEDTGPSFWDMATDPWEAVAMAVGDAAKWYVEEFAAYFTSFPTLDLQSDNTGLETGYGISMGIGVVVAAVLLILQTARSVITQEGKALAQGLTGMVKAAVAMMVTFSVSYAGLVTADRLTEWIIKETVGSAEKLGEKLAALFVLGAIPPSNIVFLALLTILITLTLWFELLLRNAAVAVLVATSPIAAVGMMSASTASWWSKLVKATIQLIILKPVIALIFGIGLTLAGESEELVNLMTGVMILLLAALAWPAVARFMTFVEASKNDSGGLAGIIGGVGNQFPSGGSRVAGMAPGDFAGASQSRTMQSAGARAQAGGAKGAVGAGGGLSAVLGGVGLGLAAAGGAANAVVRRAEATAGHAGLDSSPFASPAGNSGRRDMAAQAVGSGKQGFVPQKAAAVGQSGSQQQSPSPGAQDGPKPHQPTLPHPDLENPVRTSPPATAGQDAVADGGATGSETGWPQGQQPTLPHPDLEHEPPAPWTWQGHQPSLPHPDLENPTRTPTPPPEMGPHPATEYDPPIVEDPPDVADPPS